MMKFFHNEKTDPSLTNGGTSNDELVSANESDSRYKVKDLIYNSQKRRQRISRNKQSSDPI